MISGASVWDDPVRLQANREALVRQLRSRLWTYEARYELRSADLEEALTSGRLHETAEVCAWVIAYQTYRALTHAG